jgi:hypothetical protein
VSVPETVRSPVQAGDALAWERLRATAIRLGITVLDGATLGRPWPDEGTAAIVGFGEHVVLCPRLGDDRLGDDGLVDDGLGADVLAMALIVAAVMGDRPAGHPCAITAPAGCVLISRVRLPRPTGPGEVATLLARACGRDVESAAFEYTAPRERAAAWEWWMPRREWRVPPDDQLVPGAGRVVRA